MKKIVSMLALLSLFLFALCQEVEIIEEGNVKLICIKEYKANADTLRYISREKPFTIRRGKQINLLISQEIVKVSNGKEEIINRINSGTNFSSTKHLQPKVVVQDLCVDTVTDVIYVVYSHDGVISFISYKKKEQTEEFLKRYLPYKYYPVEADIQISESFDELRRYRFTVIQAEFEDKGIIINLSTDKHMAVVRYDLESNTYSILKEKYIP